MTQKEIVSELKSLVKDFQDKEQECFREMSYCHKHRYHLEEEAIRYRQETYNRCWLELDRVVEKILEKI